MAKDKLYKFRIEKNLLIPLSDGVSLAADLHLPEAKGPFPTLVNYYPYHKDERLGAMFAYSKQYFAERGYASLLVDFRGTGVSGGLLLEPFDPREHKDGAEIIEWAASQPWCDGNVGMWGFSYGGVTTLQTASQNPPHLRAIASGFTTADMYHGIAYPGGCLSCLSVYGMWTTTMLAMNLMPPTNADADGRWYRMWKERLGKILPFGFPWQEHPTYDEYWQSRAVPVEKIKVPAFLMGGWRDIVPEAVVRIYEQLSVPKKLLMGPWCHIRPDVSLTLEPMDYLQELLRWWDYWLKGEKNDIMDEPPVAIFVQGGNTWRHEGEWPIARTEMRTLFLASGKNLVERAPSGEGSDSYRAIPTVGAMSGLWDSTGLGLDYPLDQGPDDLLSLTYTTDPLPDDIEITGSPEAVLHIVLDSGEETNLVAKMNEVKPDGSSSLITTGWLKASHYRSHEQPERLQTGQVYEFRIPLWATCYLVSKGHRLRLSVSCSDFPHIFPTPTNPEIRLFFGGSHASSLHIPVVPPQTTPLPVPHIPRPEPGVNRNPSIIEGFPRWKIEQDLVNGTLTVTCGSMGRLALPNGSVSQTDATAKASVATSRPDGAKVDSQTTIHINMPDGEVIQVESKGWCSQKRTLQTAKVTVDGQLFFEKQWLR